MTSYKDAFKIITDEFKSIKLKSINVPLLNSLGSILAENIFSPSDFPPFNNSAVDGIAVIFSENRTQWNILGYAKAGTSGSFTLTEDSCVKIMTGAKVPHNADTIIPVEDIIIQNDKAFLKVPSITKGQHNRLKGEDFPAGSLALPKGTLIQAKEIHLLASCGYTNVNVFAPLNIAIFSTGDELIEISEPVHDDKIHASNLYSLLAQISAIKMNGINFGLARDDKQALLEKLNSVLQSDVDIILSTGGVSVGEFDYLKEVFNEADVKLKFWGVNIRPGKPLAFGVYKKNNKTVLVFGLPGNPVSSFVNFDVFIKPAINLLYGQSSFHYIHAKLTKAVSKNDDKKHFQRAALIFDESENIYKVIPYSSQSSGNLFGLSFSNCLVILEEELTYLKEGSFVKCILI